mmetsp:Transcript_23152/g.39343  ORF Transcript_23152/g.39343 Transcript_23152/m.39343 type:complete len:153 (+) Transcript_23152:53-511(+)
MSSSVGPARPKTSDFAAADDSSASDDKVTAVNKSSISGEKKSVGPAAPTKRAPVGPSAPTSSSTTASSTTSTTSRTTKVGPSAPTGPRKAIDKTQSKPTKDPYAGVRVGKLSFKNKKKKEEKKDALATFEQRLNERSKTKSDRYCMHIFRDS